MKEYDLTFLEHLEFNFPSLGNRPGATLILSAATIDPRHPAHLQPQANNVAVNTLIVKVLQAGH